jgi:hypothetical protein
LITSTSAGGRPIDLEPDFAIQFPQHGDAILHLLPGAAGCHW